MKQFAIEIDYTQAACVDIEVPDIFWPATVNGAAAHAADTELAKEFCKVCSQKAACLNWALHHERDGIWGETTPQERHDLRKAMKIVLDPPKIDHK